MDNVVDCVLLIDDSKATNFFNSTVLAKHKSFDKIFIKQSGKAALEYLSEVEKGKALKPKLIFLDLNMPAMNGWEFLIEYEELNPCLTDDITVIILTTSSDHRDIEKSKSNDLVKDLINKPLSLPILNNVISKHFFNTSQL